MPKAAVTYWPAHNAIVKGSSTKWVDGAMSMVASMRPRRARLNMWGQTIRKAGTNTRFRDPAMRYAAALVAANKDKILTKQLGAADFVANKDNLDHLILVRLYNQLMGKQQKWFWLDEMFTTIQMDKLTLRMPFRDNPAAAQWVPRHERFDVTAVAYDEVVFDLQKLVTAFSVPIEDPLRAMISPIPPFQETNDFANKYARELEAYKALKQLKYYYDKSKAGRAAFETESAGTVTNDNDSRISNPNTLGADAVHSTYKPANEFQKMRTAFLKLNDVILTHGACSPTTAMEIAQNTWTAPNTIFNVEAYRTAGGVRPFPGLSDATMVISPVVDDNVVYWSSKPLAPLVKGEGPKITKEWTEEAEWVDQTATADFFQYKCAHEDLELERQFGCITEISTA